MTDRMRKALELIASGEGPQGGFLTRLQMMGIAKEAVKLDQMDRDGYDTFTPPRSPATPQNLDARLPGYTVDDLLK
jgi:hypothetical protein